MKRRQSERQKESKWITKDLVEIKAFWNGEKDREILYWIKFSYWIEYTVKGKPYRTRVERLWTNQWRIKKIVNELIPACMLRSDFYWSMISRSNGYFIVSDWFTAQDKYKRALKITLIVSLVEKECSNNWNKSSWLIRESS